MPLPHLSTVRPFTDQLACISSRPSLGAALRLPKTHHLQPQCNEPVCRRSSPLQHPLPWCTACSPVATQAVRHSHSEAVSTQLRPIETHRADASRALALQGDAAQQQGAGIFSGACLVAAGALACSFISLQVKLFDHHVLPLQVTACSSAVAWVATSMILAQQGASRRTAGAAAAADNATAAPASSEAAAGHEAQPTPAAAAAAAAGGPPGLELPQGTQSLLLLRGLLGAATVTAYYAAVEELPLPVAVALFFFHPVLALLLDAAVRRRVVSPQAAASCALTVMGVLVIGWHDQLMLHVEQAAAFVEVFATQDFEAAAAAAAAAGGDVVMGPELSLYGVLMGLLAASANAAAFVVVGLIGPRVPTLQVCWWQYCVTTHAAVAVLLLSELEAALLPVLTQQAAAAGGGGVSWDAVAAALLQALGQQPTPDAGTSAAAAVVAGGSGGQLAAALHHVAQEVLQAAPSQHDALLLSGVVAANFAGQLLLNAGFQKVDAGRGAALNTLQVLFANVWDVLLLHSAPSAAMVAGSGMIAAGVVGTRQSAAAEPVAEQQQQQQQQQLQLHEQEQQYRQQQQQQLLHEQEQQ